MRETSAQLGALHPASVVVLVVAGVAVVASLSLGAFFAGPADASSMDLWEASARGLATVEMVNVTVHAPGGDVVEPVGIRVTNAATVPVTISDFPVLMSPLPSQSPQPRPTATTQDAVLSNATVPPGGSIVYGYGEDVAAGWLNGPSWWCMEEVQYTQAGVVFAVGGQTLPFALRPLVENPYYKSPADNTQIALWAGLRSSPAAVVSKEPLWTSLNTSAGQKVRVRIDATNMALWATDDAFTQNVNVTDAVIDDVVPVGWSVEAGSYSVAPNRTVANPDGSETLVWVADLPAANVSLESNPLYPAPFTTVTRAYTLVSPALNATTAAARAASTPVTVPRATVDVNGDGIPDAESAPVAFAVTAPAGTLTADAGGPYAGNEGDTLVLNASGSRGPAGATLQYRWSFTDNGSWDTSWSADPVARVRYTDEFAGHVRVEVTDGSANASGTAAVTVANVPPTVTGLRAGAAADFRLLVAGVKGHTLTLTVHANGTDVARVDGTRAPGDPNATAADTGVLLMDLGQPVTVSVVYNSSASDVGALPTGDNPGMLVITFPDGSNATFFHNFNVRHPDTWTWMSEDLRPLFRGRGLMFTAHLHDPGSDPLTAVWNFGDGTNATQVFPNGPANDTPEDVLGGISPFDVEAAIGHAYAAAGTFTVTLVVQDPDGGGAEASITVTVG